MTGNPTTHVADPPSADGKRRDITKVRSRSNGSAFAKVGRQLMHPLAAQAHSEQCSLYSRRAEVVGRRTETIGSERRKFDG